MTREELWLAAIAGVAGVVPPDLPVWHYEQMLAAIYDAVTGAADPRPFPARSWHLDEVLYAVYCAAAGLDDPGCPAPTCRIEEFWKGIHDAATGDDSASVPDPVWRIEEFLAGIFDVASGWGASVLTETGNAPLTLANAIARAIRSLTQTGLCTQSTTPTPDAPVDIMCNNGAIKVSPNLLDSSAENTTLGKYIEKNTGKVSNSSSNFMFEEYMPVVGGKTYVAYGRTWDGTDFSDYNRVAWYNSSKTWISGANYTQNQISVVTAPSNAAYARFSCNITGSSSTTVTQELVDSYYWVFQEGTEEPSVVHPYHELYVEGTPEVLTIGNQTASVQNLLAVGDYADTQEIISGAITRKCGIKVFDGTEAWTADPVNDASGNKVFSTQFTDRAGGVTGLTLFCSHYEQAPAGSSSTLTTGKFLYKTSSTNKYVYFDGGTNLSITSWKAWLAAQYAAGTPVIVLYPLAEPTTESVAGQSLSTAEGTNTVSVTAEVSPVALTCEYYGASS